MSRCPVPVFHCVLAGAGFVSGAYATAGRHSRRRDFFVAELWLHHPSSIEIPRPTQRISVYVRGHVGTITPSLLAVKERGPQTRRRDFDAAQAMIIRATERPRIPSCYQALRSRFSLATGQASRPTRGHFSLAVVSIELIYASTQSSQSRGITIRSADLRYQYQLSVGFRARNSACGRAPRCEACGTLLSSDCVCRALTKHFHARPMRREAVRCEALMKGFAGFFAAVGGG